MNNGTLITVIGSVIVAVITALGILAVARKNAESAEHAVTLPPYEALADRVSKLEVSDEAKSEKIGRLNDNLAVVISDRDSLVAYVKQWSLWFMAGANPPPPPVPTHLRDLLDPDLWDVAHVTETTTTTRYATPPTNGGDA